MTRRKLNTWTPFVDIMMNGLLGIMAMFAIMAAQVKQESKAAENVLETEGKYVVVMSWEDASNADVDLYVRDPNGNIAWFDSRDTGLMNLEYDDLGSRSDRVQSQTGGTIAVEKNQERVILRGVIPGEYVVNVRMYALHEESGADVHVKLYKLRGADEVLYQKDIRLNADKDEKTAFRFSVDSAEDVKGFNELPAVMSQQGRR